MNDCLLSGLAAERSLLLATHIRGSRRPLARRIELMASGKKRVRIAANTHGSTNRDQDGQTGTEARDDEMD